MATTLWIKANDITKNTPLGGNIDVNKIVPYIMQCQVFTIEEILGTKLYNKINQDIIDDTLSGIYLQIFDNYVKWILIYVSASRYVKIGAYNITNGGIFKHQPENAVQIGKTEVDYISQNIAQDAQTYINRLQKFLCDQQNNIPEYTTAQDNNYDIDPNRDVQSTGGWFLSGKRYVHRDAYWYAYNDIYESQGKE